MTTAEKGVKKVKRRSTVSETRIKKLVNRIENLEKQVKKINSKLKKQFVYLNKNQQDSEPQSLQ